MTIVGIQDSLPRPEDPEAALAAVVALRRLAGQLESEAVVEAIAQGWTWAQVGQALGVSGQAAHKKFATEARARGAGEGDDADEAHQRGTGRAHHQFAAH